MTISGKYQGHIKPLLLVLAILLLSRALFIYLMPGTWSKDLHAWLGVIDVLKNGGNPYSETRVLNWPPFWMQMLFAIGRVAEWTALPPTKIIQAVLIAGEGLVLVTCYGMLHKIGQQRKIITALIVSLAVNPVCIYLNCLHCNFDVFAGLWILLFTYALLGFYDNRSLVNWLAACFFLGIGILTKTVPFILTPLLIVGVQKQKPAVLLFGSMLLIAPVLIGMSIIYSLAPAGVSEHVLGYRSMAGWYGISGIFNLFSVYHAIDIYSAVSPWLISGLMLLVAFRIRRREALDPHELITALLTLLVFVPTFGPGYSPPYILWYLPLLVVYYFIAPPATRKMLLAGYIILALNYTTEYAFFNSHGAFIKFFDSSGKMAALCEYMGESKSQSFIRLPMFACYLVFYILLLRDKRNGITHSKKMS